MISKYTAIPPPGMLEVVFGGRPFPKQGLEVSLDEALELARSGFEIEGHDLPALLAVAKERNAALEKEARAALAKLEQAEQIAADVEKALEKSGGES